MKRAVALAGVTCALLGGVPGAAQAASTGGLTWKVYVQGKLVNSSAAPTSYQESPFLDFEPGHSATVRVTYVTNFPITLGVQALVAAAGSPSPLYLPQGVSVAISGTTCTPDQGGGDTVQTCATLPAGTNNIYVTFSVSTTSPFLRQPASFGYLSLQETLIPFESAMYGGLASADTYVHAASATAPTPARPSTAPKPPRVAASTAPATGAPSPLPSAAATASGSAAPPSPAYSPSIAPRPSSPAALTAGSADRHPAAASSGITSWLLAVAALLAAGALAGAYTLRRRARAPQDPSSTGSAEDRSQQ